MPTIKETFVELAGLLGAAEQEHPDSASLAALHTRMDQAIFYQGAEVGLSEQDIADIRNSVGDGNVNRSGGDKPPPPKP